MSDFPCRVTVLNMPAQVAPGQLVTLEARVEWLQPGATLGFVILALYDAGEYLRFAKKSGDLYAVSYRVPERPSREQYRIGVYATGDNGVCTQTQTFCVQIRPVA